MQSYSTIVGVVELRSQGISYATTQKRYGVGSSTVTLIMKRCRELGLTLDSLRRMEPKEVKKSFYPPDNLKWAEKPLPFFDYFCMECSEGSWQFLKSVVLEDER